MDEHTGRGWMETDKNVEDSDGRCGNTRREAVKWVEKLQL